MPRTPKTHSQDEGAVSRIEADIRWATREFRSIRERQKALRAQYTTPEEKGGYLADVELATVRHRDSVWEHLRRKYGFDPVSRRWVSEPIDLTDEQVIDLFGRVLEVEADRLHLLALAKACSEAEAAGKDPRIAGFDVWLDWRLFIQAAVVLPALHLTTLRPDLQERSAGLFSAWVASVTNLRRNSRLLRALQSISDNVVSQLRKELPSAVLVTLQEISSKGEMRITGTMLETVERPPILKQAANGALRGIIKTIGSPDLEYCTDNYIDRRPDVTDPALVIEQKFEFQRAQLILERLPSKLKTAIELVDFEGHTVAHAASLMGIKTKTAEMRLYRGRKRAHEIASALKGDNL